MRRLIPIAAAAVLALPATAHAATQATSAQSVTADVANTLEATFPTAYAWGALNAGTAGNTSAEQTVTVKSNASWGVKIASDLADGRLKEWNGSAYVSSSPKILTNALQWRLSTLGGTNPAGGFASLSSTQAQVTTGQGATGDSGTAVGVTYKQVVSYADAAAGANDYRIELTYDVSQGY